MLARKARQALQDLPEARAILDLPAVADLLARPDQPARLLLFRVRQDRQEHQAPPVPLAQQALAEV